MTTNELKQLLIDNGATDEQSMIDAIEDGTTLTAIGVTDADQGTVEDLHAELRSA